VHRLDKCLYLNNNHALNEQCKTTYSLHGNKQDRHCTRNVILTRWRNQFCHAKEITLKYDACVSVFLPWLSGMQIASSLRRIILPTIKDNRKCTVHFMTIKRTLRGTSCDKKYPDIYLKPFAETTKFPSQDSQIPGRGLNQRPVEYEAAVFTSRFTSRGSLRTSHQQHIRA
jgi:hypothetical protein